MNGGTMQHISATEIQLSPTSATFTLIAMIGDGETLPNVQQP